VFVEFCQANFSIDNCLLFEAATGDSSFLQASASWGEIAFLKIFSVNKIVK
jgi:hypothetical protein